MAVRAGWLNILIQRGASYRQTFRFYDGVVCAVKPSANDSVLQVRKLSKAVPSGTELVFDNCVLTASATANVGAYSIPVTVVQGQINKLVAGDVASAAPLDLTGYAARARLRKRYTDSTPLLVFVATVSNPSQGEVVISVADTVTEALKLQDCNAKPEDLPEDLQNKDLFSEEVLKRAYRWDLELEDSSGFTTRYQEGYAFLTAESSWGG